MATKNNWLTSNLKNRFIDKNCDLKIIINQSTYQKMSFENSVFKTINELQQIGKPIYIGLSGGLDSEFVVRKFVECKVDFKPLIISHYWYKNELTNAYNVCKELNLTPVVLEKSSKQLIECYKNEIIDKLNSFAFGSIPQIECLKYVLEKNGIFVKSEHAVGDDINKKTCVEFNEWDFFNECLIENAPSYDFFMYNREICYSMIKAISDVDSQTFKCNLYGLPYREKIVGDYEISLKKYIFEKRLERNIIGSKFTLQMKPQLFLERYFHESKQIK